jgi:hypothetical protein
MCGWTSRELQATPLQNGFIRACEARVRIKIARNVGALVFSPNFPLGAAEKSLAKVSAPTVDHLAGIRKK